MMRRDQWQQDNNWLLNRKNRRQDNRALKNYEDVYSLLQTARDSYGKPGEEAFSGALYDMLDNLVGAPADRSSEESAQQRIAAYNAFINNLHTAEAAASNYSRYGSQYGAYEESTANDINEALMMIAQRMRNPDYRKINDWDFEPSDEIRQLHDTKEDWINKGYYTDFTAEELLPFLNQDAYYTAYKDNPEATYIDDYVNFEQLNKAIEYRWRSAEKKAKAHLPKLHSLYDRRGGPLRKIYRQGGWS